MAKIKGNPIHETIYRLNVGAPLDLKYLEEAFKLLLHMKKGSVRDVQLGCLLTGIMVKKPSVDELEAILSAVFSQDKLSPYNDRKDKITLPEGRKLIGAVGSGKKGVETINISTASMVVASSLGVYTAKPGSSSVSSLTGSSDVLSNVGVDVNLPIDQMKKVVQETGFGIFKIENYLTRFGDLYNNRLFTPHALSYGLAALANPVQVDHLLYGFTHPDVLTSVKLLLRFNFRNALVVSCSHDGIHYIDEFGIYGTNIVIGVRNGTIGKAKRFQPTELLGLPKYTYEDIKQGNSAFENVKLVVDILSGKGRKPLEDIVAINASALLYIDSHVSDLREGYLMAKKAIKTGKPLEKLEQVIEATGGNKRKLGKYLK